MTVPNWWEAFLLFAAAYRVWRLLAVDTILDPIRDRLFPNHLSYWSVFLSCPWCAGFWVTIAWWAAWEATPHWTLVVAAPWALSLLTGLTARNLDP